MTARHVSTDQLKRACEDGSFCHDMAFQIAAERDSLRRALEVVIREQGKQFKLREAAEAELGLARRPSVLAGKTHVGAMSDHMEDAVSALHGQRETFDLITHLWRQRNWSERTFGPGERTEGVCDHIEKELREIRESRGDIEEWIDVAILAFDGAWRCGATPEQIASLLAYKQSKNERRKWPDWRTVEPGKAIEHIRTEVRRDDEKR